MPVSEINKIIIIGKTPPPIGGVTIHVKRLIDHIIKNQLEYVFVPLKIYDISKWLISSFWKKGIIHIHSSSPYVRFIFSFVFVFSRYKTTLTYHADFERFKGVKKILDKLAIFFINQPIVINKKSFDQAKGINKNTILLSAFLPPIHTETLNYDLYQLILNKRLDYTTTYCLNASQIGIDKFGNEIYCGSELIELFSHSINKNKFLIFSDPSGQYSNFFSNKIIPDNILIIDYPHSFFEILKLSDVFIRYTTTDGDAISIHEALYLGKPVIASDVVDRPNGVHIVKLQKYKLQELLDKGASLSVSPPQDTDPFERLLQVYRSLSI